MGVLSTKTVCICLFVFCDVLYYLRVCSLFYFHLLCSHTIFWLFIVVFFAFVFFPFCFRTVIAFWLDPAEIWISGDITTGLLYRIVNVYWHNYFAFPV